MCNTFSVRDIPLQKATAGTRDGGGYSLQTPKNIIDRMQSSDGGALNPQEMDWYQFMCHLEPGHTERILYCGKQGRRDTVAHLFSKPKLPQCIVT